MATLGGLELGATRAVAVRLGKRSTDVWLEAATVAKLDAAGGDAERAAAVAAAVGERAARTEMRLGVPGRDAILRYLQLPIVPRWRLRLLMEVEVGDVAEKAGEALSADYRTLAIPDDISSGDGTTVLVGLAKEAAELGKLEALSAAGLRIGGLLPTSIALFDAYVGLGFTDENRTVVLVDAGPEGAELVIARSGALVFARGFPAQETGGEHMGRREAQHLAAAVAASLPFARSQLKLRALPLDQVLVTGAYGRSPELIEALKQALKVEVSTFDPLERIDLSRLDAEARAAIESRGPELTLAVGLALASAHARALELDLTPKTVLARREFATRTVFLYAAGALLAVALLVAGATAAIARKNAVERRTELSKIRTQLEARRDAVDKQAAENKRVIQVVDALSKRTQPGAAVLRLLARLRAATPARVTISEVLLEPSLALKLRGEVDNAAGDAIQVLGRFEAALREDPGVASAKVTGTPVAQPGALLEFALAVTMRPAAPPGEE